MEHLNLIWVCVAAFLADTLLLIFLSLVMRLVMAAFPAKEKGTDAALMAALASVLQSLFPGSKVTKVEEVK